MPLSPPLQRKLLIAILVLAVSVIGGWLWSRASEPALDARLTTPGEVPYPSIATNSEVEGMSLPQATLMTIDNKSIETNTFLGKPLILNFWYSTCEPCRREMPVLAASEAAHNSTVRFIGININDSVETAREFVAKYNVVYDIMFDPSGSFVSDLGIATAPMTLFVNAQGIIVDQVAGELTAEKLDGLISKWFAQ